MSDIPEFEYGYGYGCKKRIRIRIWLYPYPYYPFSSPIRTPTKHKIKRSKHNRFRKISKLIIKTESLKQILSLNFQHHNHPKSWYFAITESLKQILILKVDNPHMSREQNFVYIILSIYNIKQQCTRKQIEKLQQN